MGYIARPPRVRAPVDDYGNAKTRFVDHRGNAVVPAASGQGPGSLDRILKRLDGQAEALVMILANTADLLPAVENRALAIVIMALAKAGPVGLTTSDVRALLTAHGFGSVRTTIVRDALVQAGVANYYDGLWIGVDPRSTLA